MTHPFWSIFNWDIWLICESHQRRVLVLSNRCLGKWLLPLMQYSKRKTIIADNIFWLATFTLWGFLIVNCNRQQQVSNFIWITSGTQSSISNNSDNEILTNCEQTTLLLTIITNDVLNSHCSGDFKLDLFNQNSDKTTLEENQRC